MQRCKSVAALCPGFHWALRRSQAFRREFPRNRK